MTIKQSIEGLFTPRYETYEIKLIGLPFTPSRVIIDGKDYQGVLVFDELKRVIVNSSKHFKIIQILA